MHISDAIVALSVVGIVVGFIIILVLVRWSRDGGTS